jgi:hypothetical protein
MSLSVQQKEFDNLILKTTVNLINIFKVLQNLLRFLSLIISPYNPKSSDKGFRKL